MFNQYQKAIEKSNIISKTDVDGIITFVNDEFCSISGYTKEELVGQNHNIVRHPDVKSSSFKLLWNTIKKKKTYKATVKNLAKDGSTFYVNTTVTPILDENENIVEYIAIRYDVTKEVVLKEKLLKKEKEYEELNKSLEIRVAEKTKELKELNKNLELRVSEEIVKNEEKQRVMFWQSRNASLGQMLANIAHQWRQPLTELSLAMFSIKKAIKDKNLDDVSKFYDESKSTIQNMSETIDNFTNFFQPQKEKHSFLLSDSIDESIRLLGKIIRNDMISIKTKYEKLSVLGVSNEFTQVIVNLINNSVDAFRTNSILIKEISIDIKQDDEFAIVEVGDNAGGITKDTIDKIFEPYFTTKHASKGTGLGLFMSKMICEQGLNGSMDVHSYKNTTKFIIKIPLERHEK